MNTGLSAAEIAAAVASAGLGELPEGATEKLSSYGELLLRWNSRLNLTAVRTSEGILQRHFLECIFCGRHLPAGISTLLDFGSGAGFPGIPIGLIRPEIQVSLAESQGKKAAFLREVVRTLGLRMDVYADRVESMPSGKTFDAVALRAVDKMDEAVKLGIGRVAEYGWLVVLTTRAIQPDPGPDWVIETRPVPGSENGVLMLARRNL